MGPMLPSLPAVFTRDLTCHGLASLTEEETQAQGVDSPRSSSNLVAELRPEVSLHPIFILLFSSVSLALFPAPFLPHLAGHNWKPRIFISPLKFYKVGCLLSGVSPL